MGGAHQAREAQRANTYISPGLNGAPEMGAVSAEGADMGAIGGTTVPGGPTLGAAPQGQSERNALSVFTGYVNPTTDIRFGENVGKNESRQDVADRHGSTPLEITRGTSRFTDIQGTEASLSEKSSSAQLGFDAHEIGAQGGLLTAGRTSAQGELLDQIARNEGVSADSAEAGRTLGLQERGEMLGAVRGATTSQYIAAAVERTKSSVAEAEQMAEDGSASLIGTARAIDADISAQGLGRTLSDFDRTDLIRGNALGRMRDAASGAEVFDSASPAAFAREQAHLAIAEQQARFDVASSLAKMLGIDPTTDEGMARLARSREGANQTITVSGDASAKDQVIDALELDPRTAAAIRNAPGGVSLSASLDAEGNIVYGAVTAGGQTRLLDSTTIERGFSEQAHYEYSVSGGRALVNERGALAGELSRVYGDGLLDGAYDDTRLIGVASGIARYLSEAGMSMSATDFESVVYSASARVSASGGIGFVSASASAGVEKLDADQRSSQQDLSFAYARGAIEVAREEALEAFRVEHARDPADANERAAVYDEMASRIQTTMTAIHRELENQTESAADGHDVSAPGEELPTPPMSDPDYANYRSPISKR
jgi:hypothetical protein